MRPPTASCSALSWSGLVLATALAMALAGCTASARPKTSSTPKASGGQTIYDVAYANASPAERLDVYLPAAKTRPAPLVVWVHGGGWRVGDKSSIVHGYDPSAVLPSPAKCNDVVQVQAPDVVALNAKGYAVAAVNYRLNSNPIDAVADAKAAVRFLRANASRYHVDPQRFAAWGDSAGGYSVIMLGLTGGQHTVFDDPSLGRPGVSASVQAVVDWFGPTEFASIPGHLGPAEDPFTYIRAGRSLPPFRIANGDNDCVVPAKESRRLYTALTKVGSIATLAILPGARHEDPAFLRTQLAPTIAFLDQTLGQ
jgi:acetyl esterase/lipase